MASNAPTDGSSHEAGAGRPAQTVPPAVDMYVWALLKDQEPIRHVVYRTDNRQVAERICRLLAKCYPEDETSGSPTFECTSVAEHDPDDCLLFDESLDHLHLLASEPDLGVFDFRVSARDKLLREFYGQAESWERRLRPDSQRSSTPLSPLTQPGDPPHAGEIPEATTATRMEELPPVEIGDPGTPCFVLREQKKPLTDAQRAVVTGLLKAGSNGLSKDALEAIRPSARRILKKLREDADWAQVILMAEQTNGRYRIRA